MASPENLLSLSFILVLTGFLAVFLAVVLGVFSSRKGGSIRGGGIIFIGPFPIVFGSDVKTASTLVYVALLIFLVSLVWMLFSLSALGR